MKINKNKGISIIEIIIIISVIGILAATIFPNLSKFKNEQTLRNTTADIVSFLNKARNDTISSVNSSNYSVHFETNRVVYFSGSVFDEDAISTDADVINLSSVVTIPEDEGVSLNGGGSDVLFTRLTGETTKYGTIIVRLVSDPTRQKTITISKTGSVSSN